MSRFTTIAGTVDTAKWIQRSGYSEVSHLQLARVLLRVRPHPHGRHLLRHVRLLGEARERAAEEVDELGTGVVEQVSWNRGRGTGVVAQVS